MTLSLSRGELQKIAELNLFSILEQILDLKQVWANKEDDKAIEKLTKLINLNFFELL
jgi:hypothetical protein